MDKLYILSPETKEEKDELETLMKLTNSSYLLYERKKFSKNKYLNKILDIISFFKFVKNSKKNGKVEILSVPSIVSRAVSVFLQTKLNIYMRGVYPSPEHKSVLSDYIDFAFKKIGINNKFTNTYKADRHLITSVVTKNFLIYRKADKNIIDIPPIWLKDIKIKQNGKRRIIFITQAFSEHNLEVAQNGQKKIIDNLITALKEKGENLILKVHPRDKDRYAGYETFDGNAQDLLNDISINDIVISAFSTLAFELSAIGANVKFISYDGVDDLYENLYLKYNIKFTKCSNENLDINFLMSEKIEYNIFNPINLDINL